MTIKHQNKGRTVSVLCTPRELEAMRQGVSYLHNFYLQKLTRLQFLDQNKEFPLSRDERDAMDSFRNCCTEHERLLSVIEDAQRKGGAR